MAIDLHKMEQENISIDSKLSERLDIGKAKVKDTSSMGIKYTWGNFHIYISL
jgi:hypothetical protein